MNKTDPVTTEERTPWNVLIPAVVLLTAPVVLISQLAAHARIDVVDDQLFGYFGWRVAHGATLYVDIWDNKPPGIYWTNALGFLISGDSYAGVVALCVLAVCVSLVCFFFICASIYFRGAAAAATVLGTFYLTHGYFTGGTNRTETFLMAFELLGVLLYFRGFARDRWWLWLLAGASFGAAFSYKQVGLAAWGACGLHTILLVVLRDLSWQRGLARCVLLTAGVLSVVAVAVGALVAQGAGDGAWFAIVSFNQAYFEQGNSSWSDLWYNRYMLSQHTGIALLLPMLMLVAAVVHATFWWLRPKFRPADVVAQIEAFQPLVPRALFLFLAWFAAAFYGAALSPHYFRHYLLPALPPLMLIAGYTLHFLRGEVALTKRLQRRMWVTCTFVAMGYFAIGALKWHREEIAKVYVHRLEQQKQAEWEAVADAVRLLSGPTDRIQCTGYMPGVYLHARRLNTSRYTTWEKIGQVYATPQAERIRRELKATLEREPPVLMVIAEGEYDAIVHPGDVELDWFGAWLADFLQTNYRKAYVVTEFNTLILRRNDLPVLGAEDRTLTANVDRAGAIRQLP